MDPNHQQPQPQFPPCSYTEFHQNKPIPTSFIMVRDPEGQYDQAKGIITHEVRGICAACVMRCFDNVLRPKANQLVMTLEKEARGNGW